MIVLLNWLLWWEQGTNFANYRSRWISIHFGVSSVNFLDQLSWPTPGLQIRVLTWKLFFLFLNQNICCGYSKEPSRQDGSFEHTKHMIKLIDKKIIAILRKLFLLNWPYAYTRMGFSGLICRVKEGRLLPICDKFVCFVWFDSLRSINNLSVKQGRVFLGWTSTKLG